MSTPWLTGSSAPDGGLAPKSRSRYALPLPQLLTVPRADDPRMNSPINARTPSSHRVPQEPWCLDLESQDIDAHAAHQPDWSLRYQQLSSGQFQGRMRHVQLPEMRLVLEETNLALRQVGRLDPGCFGFAMPLQSTKGFPIFNGQRVPFDAIMSGRGNDIDLCTPPDFSLIAVVVDEDLLAPLWERMYLKPLSQWLEQQLVLKVSPVMASHLRQLHLQALVHASQLSEQGASEFALAQLRDDILVEWIETLPSSVDTSELPSLNLRKRLVDKACELMLAHPDEPLSMLQVCSRIGTSRRKLNYCFQDVLGISPIKYLRALRLNSVRRDLLSARPGTTVQDIATHWGFMHLSQFSLDYKRQFKELPSQTLKRPK